MAEPVSRGGVPTITFQIKGLDELKADLKDVSARVATNALRSAIRAAGKMVIDAAKGKAPVRRGKLRKSITQKVSAKRGLVQTKIGFLKKAYYGGFVERGHALVRNGKVVGSVSAQPFLRPALDENKPMISDIFAAMVRSEIAKRRAKGRK